MNEPLFHEELLIDPKRKDYKAMKAEINKLLDLDKAIKAQRKVVMKSVKDVVNTLPGQQLHSSYWGKWVAKLFHGYSADWTSSKFGEFIKDMEKETIK